MVQIFLQESLEIEMNENLSSECLLAVIDRNNKNNNNNNTFTGQEVIIPNI